MTDNQQTAYRTTGEVARLENIIHDLSAKIEDWQDASGLCCPSEEAGGDPGGVTPEHLRRELERRGVEMAALRTTADVALSELGERSRELAKLANTIGGQRTIRMAQIIQIQEELILAMRSVDEGGGDDAIDALDEIITRRDQAMRAELADLQARLAHKTAEVDRCKSFDCECIHCGFTEPYDLDIAKDHWRECLQHPARMEVERLSSQIESMREPIPLGVGAVAIAQGYSADDPDRIEREVVIYPIDQLPVGTELPADMGKTSTELNALVRMRVVDPEGAFVLVETILAAIEAAAVADEATSDVKRA